MNPMVVVVAFAATLLVAALVSARANRSILSTAVVFLAAGFLLGDGVGGVRRSRTGSGTCSTSRAD